MIDANDIEIFDIDINTLEELIYRSTINSINTLLCQKILKEINNNDSNKEK